MLITTFASNAARLETIGRVAIETGRQVCVAGRSLDRILRVAKATGYLLDFPEPVRFDEAMRLPREEVLIIATGGQGEPRAALGRIAFGKHELKLAEGDTVIFSSQADPRQRDRDRPDHERACPISASLIVTERQAHVHVSGHPGRPELAAMYRWMRPADPGPGPWRGAPHARAGALRRCRRAFPTRSSSATATSSASRPTGPRRSARSASAGWCSTATSSFPPTARRSTSGARSPSTG